MDHLRLGALLPRPIRAGMLAVAFLIFFGCAPHDQASDTRETAVPFYAASGVITEVSRTKLESAALEKGVELELLPSTARNVMDLDVPLRHGQFVWSEVSVAPGSLTIWIDLRRQILSVFRNGQEIGTSTIVYGAPTYPTPLGRFAVRRKVADYRSRAFDADMPHSLFFAEDGVALHGSDMSADHATHGCVGLPHDFARRLFEAASVGDEVIIVRSRKQVQYTS